MLKEGIYNLLAPNDISLHIGCFTIITESPNFILIIWKLVEYNIVYMWLLYGHANQCMKPKGYNYAE